MKTDNQADFVHDSPEAVGVLLTNLGTPDSCATSDVRRYLKEFLWDPRVVEMPRVLWWPLLNLVILNTRPRRSAAAYEKVWSDAGSPLLVISRQQADALQSMLDAELQQPVTVALAMRYGNPSIAAGLEALRRAGARRILVLPLYPQYSATTTASTFDAVCKELRGWRWLPELRFVNHYHDDPGYISALAQSVKTFWQTNGEPDKLLMSFHGIPRDYFLAGDPYFCECQKTGRLLAEALGLSADRWQISFQSRLGPRQWLQPYTDKSLKMLAKSGIKTIHVICPGFSADCLETLEEIAVENRDLFLAAGGERYAYIPCLNSDPSHMEMLKNLVSRHISGWVPALSEAERAQVLRQRRELAVAMGAAN
ncbi:MAG: ferrochelatase [Gammaproteobacteria bacterium]|nr:ferrochelatase [Gammaproteobacteria bacterium]HXK55511.1 ferrochelatase [Gammaproteobacteria bacterium]